MPNDTSTGNNTMGWVITLGVIFLIFGGVGGVQLSSGGDPTPATKTQTTAKPKTTSGSDDTVNVMLQAGWPTRYPQVGVLVTFSAGGMEHTIHEPFRPGHVQTDLSNRSVPWVGAIKNARWNLWSFELENVPRGTKVSVGVTAHGALVGCAITTSTEQKPMVEVMMNTKKCILVVK